MSAYQTAQLKLSFIAYKFIQHGRSPAKQPCFKHIPYSKPNVNLIIHQLFIFNFYTDRFISMKLSPGHIVDTKSLNAYNLNIGIDIRFFYHLFNLRVFIVSPFILLFRFQTGVIFQNIIYFTLTYNLAFFHHDNHIAHVCNLLHVMAY